MRNSKLRKVGYRANYEKFSRFMRFSTNLIRRIGLNSEYNWYECHNVFGASVPKVYLMATSIIYHSSFSHPRIDKFRSWPVWYCLLSVEWRNRTDLLFGGGVDFPGLGNKKKSLKTDPRTLSKKPYVWPSNYTKKTTKINTWCCKIWKNVQFGKFAPKYIC